MRGFFFSFFAARHSFFILDNSILSTYTYSIRTYFYKLPLLKRKQHFKRIDMKMFLVLAVAALSMSAFASKSMVTLSGYEGGNSQDRSLDFSNSTGSEPDGASNKNTTTNNIALNYAYAVTDAVQVGASYKNFRKEVSGVNDESSSKSMGLQVIYNFAGQLSDTNYVAVHYDVKTLVESNDKTNTWSAEFGHRFSMGTVWGMNFNYSPSASLALAKTAIAASGSDDYSSTSVTLNFVKFDVLF